MKGRHGRSTLALPPFFFSKTYLETLSLGVTKTYKLTYESTEILRATFDQLGSTNHWTMQSRTARDITEYFGPRTEHLDWFYESGRVTFTSYTEKVTDGKREFDVH